MKTEVTQEMLNKAKGAKTAQELQELAKAEGITLTEEAAEEAFEKLHAQNGELSDEELENVAGGGYISYNYKTGKFTNTTGVNITK